jgi:hypothetical protein
MQCNGEKIRSYNATYCLIEFIVMVFNATFNNISVSVIEVVAKAGLTEYIET